MAKTHTFLSQAKTTIFLTRSVKAIYRMQSFAQPQRNGALSAILPVVDIRLTTAVSPFYRIVAAHRTAALEIGFSVKVIAVRYQLGAFSV